jgi:formylglycine-generating enzyme
MTKSHNIANVPILMKSLTSIVIAGVVASAFAAAGFAGPVNMEVVPVGNINNAADPQPRGTFGSVSYKYNIGKYEVTNDQYTAFLNAVAATDTFGLYTLLMGSDNAPGGIKRSGSSGNYAYAVKANMGNKPVVFVSFWSAARFVNWLHNGQPIGLQGNTTTEAGAYNLGGILEPPNTIQREPNARWFIPTEDEWHKAAYYDPAKPGGAGYWDYATGSDTPPTIATANSAGDISNPGTNVANYINGAIWNDLNGNVTTVGSAGPGSASPYGTFDQAGNLMEWTEAIYDSAPYRRTRDGGYNGGVNLLDASTSSLGWVGSGGGNSGTGFRVASIPEPTSSVIAITAAIGFWRLRRKKFSV